MSSHWWIRTLLFASVIAAPVAAQDEAEEEARDGENEVWAYLEKKYDADGDGAVTRAEYDREDTTYLRLDSNDDGVLTADDFRTPDGRMRGAGGDMLGRVMTQRIMMSALSTDDSPGELRREQIAVGFGRLDRDQDGRLVAAEFEGVEVSLDGLPMMMRDRLGDPYQTLASRVDADEDGALTEAELVTWFDEVDDGDGIWSSPRRGRGQGRSRGRRERGTASADPTEEESSGPPPGTTAPDFTLSPLHAENEGDSVTLSSYAGKQPVALIFGSYT